MSSLAAHVRVLASMMEDAGQAEQGARKTSGGTQRTLWREAYAAGYHMALYDAYRAARDALEEQKGVRERIREAVEIGIRAVGEVEGSHTLHETVSDNEGEGNTK